MCIIRATVRCFERGKNMNGRNMINYNKGMSKLKVFFKVDMVSKIYLQWLSMLKFYNPCLFNISHNFMLYGDLAYYHCKDMPELKFTKVIEKRYTYILNLTYLAPLITTPGLQFQVRMEGKKFWEIRELHFSLDSYLTYNQSLGNNIKLKKVNFC